jgi:hypothetical protein
MMKNLRLFLLAISGLLYLSLSGQSIHELWSVDALNSYVLIDCKNMDDDIQLELIYVQHITGNPAWNSRIVIFDGISGLIDYDSGMGNDHYNVAGFNWTSSSGSNLNTGMEALHDLNGDGKWELVFNRNGQTNEIIGFNGTQISLLWSVDCQGTYVLIGAEQMDNDLSKELVFVNHVIGGVNYNSRIVIFDGSDGSIDYDSGSGINNNYNVAGHNWTTSSGSDINTGTEALYDLNGDGKWELVYNLNGLSNEVIGFDGADIATLWSVDCLGTYVFIGAAQMDTDQWKELVFVDHKIGGQNYTSRIVIFDGSDGSIDYDSGPGINNNYNIAGFNWTTSTGSNINTGAQALFDLNKDGMWELIYNKNGQTNEVIGYNGSKLDIQWAVDCLGTYVLVGAQQMDNDTNLELVFVKHETGGMKFNSRIVIFDGSNGGIDFDTGYGNDHYNIAGFNWTCSSGSNINTGKNALHDLNGDGKWELFYNRNTITNELVGFEGTDINVLWTAMGEGTNILIGAKQMDEDPGDELVCVRHEIGGLICNNRIVIFNGSDGAIEYDTGLGNNHYNISGFNWTCNLGNDLNTGFNSLFDVDSNGKYELVFNQNGSQNKLVGWNLLTQIKSTQPASSAKIDLYPNPISQILHIDWMQQYPGSVTVSIIDIKGVIISSIKFDNMQEGKQHQTLDLRSLGLSPGQYYFSITQEDEMIYIPIIYLPG